MCIHHEWYLFHGSVCLLQDNFCLCLSRICSVRHLLLNCNIYLLEDDLGYIFSEATMRRVFTMFDKDGNGSIDRDELKQVFEELGQFFPQEELQKMIDMADKDDSGSLEYEEFIKVVSGRRKKKKFQWPM